jgi:hypothetical protein
VVYTTFHHPDTQANVITTDFSDWATNCPEYKVTAVQVSAVERPVRVAGGLRLRAPEPVTLSRHLTPAQVCAAVAALPAMQPLHDATRAAHAAAFWTPRRGIVALREDVGRHNALDKLAGAMALAGTPRDGAVVLTSRVSIDMVQKTAALGVPVLIAVSAPTAHAVEMAEAAGITLIALARPDRFEIFTHPHRITPRIPPMSPDKLTHMANQIATLRRRCPNSSASAQIPVRGKAPSQALVSSWRSGVLQPGCVASERVSRRYLGLDGAGSAERWSGAIRFAPKADH